MYEQQEPMQTQVPEDTSDLVYLEADMNYTYFHFSDGSSELRSYTLKRYEAKLGANFLRLHHKYLVNCAYITGIANSPDRMVILQGGKQIPISRRRGRG